MKQIKFVFILIILIVFFKINIEYKKTHNNQSVLDESKVEKTIHAFSLLDIISRFAGDIIISS